jgi:predicted DNA-binding protein YlxM (UPF0122 family)
MVKRINKKRQIRQAVEYSDRWLIRRQKRHVNMIEVAIRNLQASILDDIQTLQAQKGRLEGVKINLKQAQKIHKRIVTEFGTEFSTATKKIIADFDNVSKVIEKSFSYLDEAASFTDVDLGALEVLKNGYLDKYTKLSGVKQTEIVQAMYNHVISREKFSSLVDVVRKNIYGTQKKGVPGTSLAQYSRLYARDMVHNFHNEALLMKAEDLEINTFLYAGNIIATTRDFCRRRCGKIYTRNQIDSWTHSWAGKSGPAFTHRGGYNCRHHWQPVRPEWLEDGEKRLDAANWDYEKSGGT